MKPTPSDRPAAERAASLASALGHGRVGLAEIAAELPALVEHRALLADALRRATGAAQLQAELEPLPEPAESALWDRIAERIEAPEPPAPPADARRGLPAGVQVHPVPVAGWQSYLLTLDVNTALPAHDHATEEVFLLLQGDVAERGGPELSPGAVIEKAPGTHHDVLHSLGGCLAWVLLRDPRDAG